MEPIFRFTPPANVFDAPSDNPDNECYCVGGPPCIGGGVFNTSVCQFGEFLILLYAYFDQIMK